MGTWNAIRARRNVRSYTPDVVSDEHRSRIVEVSCRAQPASNRQHWDFIVVTDRHKSTEVAIVWQCARRIFRGGVERQRAGGRRSETRFGTA